MGPQIRKSFSLRNNEMVVDMPSVTAGLPHSIEAVFYVAGGSAEKEAEARDVWTRFMEVYGLSEVCACVRWRLGCVCACYVCACYVCACECCVPAWVCACVRMRERGEAPFRRVSVTTRTRTRASQINAPPLIKLDMSKKDWKTRPFTIDAGLKTLSTVIPYGRKG